MGSPSVSNYGNANFRRDPLGAFMNAAVKSNPLGWVKLGDYALNDPLDLAGNNKAAKPPPVGAPPPPPDTTASMLREISRAETDRELRRGRRSMLWGGETYRAPGSKATTGG